MKYFKLETEDGLYRIYTHSDKSIDDKNFDNDCSSLFKKLRPELEKCYELIETENGYKENKEIRDAIIDNNTISKILGVYFDSTNDHLEQRGYIPIEVYSWRKGE